MLDSPAQRPTMRLSSLCLHTSSAREPPSFWSSCPIFIKLLLLGIFSYFVQSHPFASPTPPCWGLPRGCSTCPRKQWTPVAGARAGAEAAVVPIAESDMVWRRGQQRGVRLPAPVSLGDRMWVCLLTLISSPWTGDGDPCSV